MTRRTANETRLRRGVLPATVIVIAIVFLPGCASTPSNNATGGVRITLLRDQGDAASLYYMHYDGTISFGGGIDARLDRTTWTGQLRDDEIDEVLNLIDRHGWFERRPVTDGQPPELLYHLEVSGPRGYKRYQWRGESPDVVPILELLDQAARRRFGYILDALPKPGPR